MDDVASIWLQGPEGKTASQNPVRTCAAARNAVIARVSLAADLHLHSRHAGGVSPAMTLRNIAAAARRKGIDLLGTGDCLQAEWLWELEAATVETGSGLLELRPELDEASARALPERVRRPLRFVLSTEVCCAPPGTPELGGIHHLLYFHSFESVRRFRERISDFGDLREGRPTLRLTSRELLAHVIEHGDDCELAPAHVLNPWFAAFGSVSGVRTPAELFNGLGPRLLAVEMGLTSTPDMCRRISALDHHALFCCSDAHSLDNVGREHTLLEIEPTYTALMNALRHGSGSVRQLVKFPVEFTRYYLNWCGSCQKSSEGLKCPRCARRLATGSRDRLQVIADRAQPITPAGAPGCLQLFPLPMVIARLIGASPDTQAVEKHYNRIISELGHERYILTQATEDEIAAVGTRQLARAIMAQRTSPPGSPPPHKSDDDGDQMSFGF